MNIIHCGECAYYNANKQGCILLQIKANPNTDFCSHADYKGKFCELCGGLLTVGGILQEGKDNNFHLICKSCAAQNGTCTTCEFSQNCKLNSYSGPEPKMVMQQVHQGNMIVQTQVLNPELVKKLCINCECYNNNKCCRQESLCKNYSSFL